jgi:hypothetical protein
MCPLSSATRAHGGFRPAFVVSSPLGGEMQREYVDEGANGKSLRPRACTRQRMTT